MRRLTGINDAGALLLQTCYTILYYSCKAWSVYSFEEKVVEWTHGVSPFGQAPRKALNVTVSSICPDWIRSVTYFNAPPTERRAAPSFLRVQIKEREKGK